MKNVKWKMENETFLLLITPLQHSQPNQVLTSQSPRQSHQTFHPALIHRISPMPIDFEM